MENQANPARGWYQDPFNARIHRFWDGQQWAENTRPAFLFDVSREMVLKVPEQQFAAELTHHFTGKRYRIQPTGTQSMNIFYLQTPTWAVVLGVIGILFFLIGALLFLVKEESHGALVAWVLQDDGLRVTTVGTNPTVNAALGWFLFGYEPAATGEDSK